MKKMKWNQEIPIIAFQPFWGGLNIPVFILSRSFVLMSYSKSSTAFRGLYMETPKKGIKRLDFH